MMYGTPAVGELALGGDGLPFKLFFGAETQVRGDRCGHHHVILKTLTSYPVQLLPPAKP
jgi:hypothetical protein